MDKVKLTEEQLNQLKNLPIGRTIDIDGESIRCEAVKKDIQSNPCCVCKLHPMRNRPYLFFLSALLEKERGFSCSFKE